MVAGHLQKKRDYWYMVLTFKDENGITKAKWKTTGLKCRGNKKKAQSMLLEYRKAFSMESNMKDISLSSNEIIACEVPKDKSSTIPTVEEYVKKYIDSIRYTVEGRTYEAKVTCSKHIIRGIGKFKITELDKYIMRNFINSFAATPYQRKKSRKKEFYSQDAINRVFDLTRNIVNEMIDDGYIEKDIMLRMKKPRSKKIKEAKNQALTVEEVRYVINLINEDIYLKTIIYMLLFLGLRPGELFALKWSDIDRKKKTIVINKALSIEPIYNIKGEKTRSYLQGI